MGSPSLSPATKASLFGVLAVAHVGLLAVMAEPADHAGPRATGGAPVINLTLMPAPRMADRDADQRAAQKLQPLPTSIPASVPMPVIRTSEPPRGPLLEIVRVPSTNQPSPVVPGAVPDPQTPPGGGDPRVDEAGLLSRSGQTAGGGAPRLGAAAAPSEDRYAAQVIAWVERHKRDPGGRVSGVAVLRFVLDRQGRLREAAIVSTQGDRQVGPIALDTLRAAQPFPRPATDSNWRTREFHVRLDYRPEGG
jgi:periplasmic protein TonB